MHRKNQLLSRLSADVIQRLRPHLQLVDLVTGQVLHWPGDEIRSLYFPLTCMISITVNMADGKMLEVGAVGSRELVPVNAFMEDRASTQTEYIVELPGEALRIRSEAILNVFDHDLEFRTTMLRSTQAFIAQLTQNAACNRCHSVERRCARWLLEVCDRVQSDSFDVTQEFIAQMLGVSRPVVNHALHALKVGGVVTYSRGHLRIVNSARLHTQACECYSVLEREYDRLLGPAVNHRF
jgi:CRP-like cAMP-binding protein